MSYRAYSLLLLSFWHINQILSEKPLGLDVREINKLTQKVMHSMIFQISTKEVSGSNLLNEDTLLQGDGTPYDYCSEIDEEVRTSAIQTLVNEILPKGMFELTGANTMIYKGGIEEWKRSCIAGIRARAEELTAENITDWVGPIYQLEKALKNPLGIGNQFYLDTEGFQCYAEESYELLRFVDRLEVGTTIYFGGVIDYHF